MRDASLTDDDLAVRAAKEKLAQLRERPGYAEALVVPPAGRAAQTVLLVLALALGALTAWEYHVVDSTIGWFRFAALLAGTVFALVMTLGAATNHAREAFPAAVLAVGATLRLLRDDGSQRELACPRSIARALRPGDVGIVRVRDHQLLQFNRL